MLCRNAERFIRTPQQMARLFCDLPEAIVPDLLHRHDAGLGDGVADEVADRDELVARFSLDRVTSSPAQFDYAKLDWLNGMYIRALSVDDFWHALVLWVGEQGYAWDAELVRKAAPLVQEKIARLDEFPAYARFLFEEVTPDPAELNGGAEVVAACFVIDLPDLGGAAKIEALNVAVRSLVSFAGH